MTRDNQERIDLFAWEKGIEVRRLALNMDQIRKYNPPPNPAKETDSRFSAYIRQYGDESWELDALEPSVIDALIRKALSELIDDQAWERAIGQEQQRVETLKAVSDRWTEVTTFLS